MKRPVHSSATSTPSCFHGSFAGSRSASTAILPRPISIQLVAGGDLAAKAAMHAVVFQQMRVGLDRAEIVDRDDLQIVAPLLVERAQHQPADAAEAVDRDA